MIPCDGIHGLSEEASTLFKQMQLACMKPDDIKFSCCSVSMDSR
jgi:pentatricopeptide repeat protein